MAQPDPPIELYRSMMAVVTKGDCRHGLQAFHQQPPAAIVTDAPYGFWKRITETVATGVVNFDQDVGWSADVWNWMTEWLVPMRAIMGASRGPAWFFCDWHYAGFYLRWARWSDWPLRAIVQCDRTELLLCFSDDACDAAPLVALDAAKMNRQGHDKPIECLMPIVASVDRPGYILDPFCGSGSTLEASMYCGRTGWGWELEDAAHAAAARVGKIEAALLRARVDLI